MSDFSDVVNTLIFICVISGFVVWGCWELIDYFFIDEVIESSHLIIPEIKLTIKDNQIDTIYIYRKP